MAARTNIAVTYMTRFTVLTATNPVPTAADTVNGNVTINDGYTYLELTNSSGASRTVTLSVPSGFDGDLLISNRIYTLPSNGVYYTGVFPISSYGSQILYTASGSGITIRAVSLRGDV